MGEPVVVTVERVDETSICTGVLVDRSWVVVPGFCVSSTFRSLADQQAVTAATRVRIGTADKTVDPGIVLAALETIPKPEFDINMPAANDIGLIKLATSVDNIAPAAVSFDPAIAPVGVSATVVSFFATQHVFTQTSKTCAPYSSDQTNLCFDARDNCLPAAALLTIEGRPTLIGLLVVADSQCSIYTSGPRTDAEKAFLISHVPQLEPVTPDGPAMDGAMTSRGGGCCDASMNGSSSILVACVLLLLLRRRSRRYQATIETLRRMILLVIAAGCGRDPVAAIDGASGIDSNEPLGDGPLGDGPVGDGPFGDGPPANCGTLASTCGPTGMSSCCDSPIVPGGTYARSYDVSGDGMYPNSSFGATVSDFRLDKYEVTVGRFRQFVNAGMGTQANPPASDAGSRTLNGMANQGGWDASFNANLTTNTTALVAALKCSPTFETWTDAVAGNESLPMTCITWYEAMAFCAWDGGFLPTEAESMYAGSGGGEQRAYPWSSPAASTTIDCSYANYRIDVPAGTKCVNGTTGATNRVGSESPKGDGKWGQSDLSGNVLEWALDWYASPYLTTTCTDCANLTVASDRILRGGSFYDIASFQRGASRGLAAPTNRGGNLGVRCARKP